MPSRGLSLRSLGALVLVAAGDLAMTTAVVRAADLGSNVHGEVAPLVFVLGVPLLGGLLVAGFANVLWGLWRRGECHAFLVGFEAFGGAALLLYLTVFVWTNGWSGLAVRYIEGILSPFDPVVTDETSAVAIAAAIVSLPMLSFALIGGVLTSRCGITLVAESRRGAGRGPDDGLASPATNGSAEL